ncbi:MAG: T9SS type A sorting domain-containing protein [Bacteroidia bacterium]|nr:T9SS type A sorting domain-containing protein [Bacteroidia bacterium]
MSIKKFIAITLLIGFATGIYFLNSATSKTPKNKFHSEDELASLSKRFKRDPIQMGQYFLHSSHCSGCHGYDSLQQANILEDGSDVNLVDRWQTSMMALSARDPLWRAKVSHEILVNPSHATALQNKCTSCHAPMGRYTAMFHNNQDYGIAELETDSLGLDGVSCSGCHSIAPNVGFTFSGNIPFDTNHVEYGPFGSPFTGPMQLYEGITPAFSSHVSQARMCASCHTLITETADLSGNLTGGEFVEQATYHEYLNSAYNGTSTKCQTCHMPKLEEPIVIANGILSLQGRFPFNQHTFAGANYFMLNLIKNNKTALGINADDAKFDSSLLATSNMLRYQSIDFNLYMDSASNDTAYFRVKLKNKTGHKFPSGYPSRRAVVQFVVTRAANDTLFKSGTFTNTYRVVGETNQFEVHHNVINQNDVPQIYEMVMGDVNSDVTTVLERAAVQLKDNRIPPLGFTASHNSYDTVKIVGSALNDADFNKTNSVEGSGVDYVHYRVPLSGFTGTIQAKAKVYYQSVPPKYTDEMFAFNSAPINTFKTMFQNADQTPFLVAADSLNNTITGISAISTNNIKVWPSISMDGKVNISSQYTELIKSIEVYNSSGARVNTIYNTGFLPELDFYLPNVSGTYFIKIRVGNKIITKKVVKS